MKKKNPHRYMYLIYNYTLLALTHLLKLSIFCSHTLNSCNMVVIYHRNGNILLKTLLCLWITDSPNNQYWYSYKK